MLQLQIVTVVRARRPPLHFPTTVDGASAVVGRVSSVIVGAGGEGEVVRAGEVGRGGRDAGRKERQREVSHANSKTEKLSSQSEGPPGPGWLAGRRRGLDGSTNGAWTCRPWLPRAPWDGRSGVGGRVSLGGDRVPESAWLGRARRVQGRRRRESWRFMDSSLILDKLSLGRDGGLAGLGDEKIRASGLADHGSLFIQAGMYRAHWTVPIITGPRADVTGTHTKVLVQ